MMLRLVCTRSLLILPLLAVACENEGDGRYENDSGHEPIDVPDPVDPPAADPGEYLEGIDGEFVRAAEEFDVPVSILKAVGFAESRWEMVEGQVEFEGRDAAFGTMALRGTNLERGAKLLGVEVEDIKKDRETNIRAAAAVLSDMAEAEGIDRADLGAWAPSIAALANIGDDAASIAYIHYDVYGLIKNGLVVTDSDGNVISEIEPEPNVEPDYQGTGGPVLATNPDYAGAIFRSSPNYSSRPAGETGKVRLVIIHSCEGAYSGCWGWLVNKQSGVSAHYVVKEDGSEISQLVKEDKKAWHIAAAYKKTLNGGQEAHLDGISSNNFTVGIEHAGFAKQAAWNANLIEQSAKLVCSITKRQGIPIDKYHVVAHGQLQPNNRIDPGPNWPWATYFNKINAACGGQPVDPPPEEPDPNDPVPDPEPPPPDPEPDPEPPPVGQDPAEIIIDSANGNNNAALAKFNASANWAATAATPGFYGSNYLFASVSPISDAAEFSFYLNNPGSKKVEIWYTAGTNRAPDAPIVVFDSAGKNLGTVKVNQQANGKTWVAVGTFNFTAGWNKIAVSRWTTGNYVVIADAIRISAI